MEKVSQSENKRRKPGTPGNPKYRENPFVGWTTIEEVAQLIGREKATIRGWANKEWISSFYVGRKVRLVNIDEVQEFSEKQSPPRHRLVDKNAKLD